MNKTDIIYKVKEIQMCIYCGRAERILSIISDILLLLPSCAIKNVFKTLMYQICYGANYKRQLDTLQDLQTMIEELDDE